MQSRTDISNYNQKVLKFDSCCYVSRYEHLNILQVEQLTKLECLIYIYIYIIYLTAIWVLARWQ
jgi:hypothetical protein